MATVKKRYGSIVRLEGALRFAEEGLDSVWFYLLPHDAPEAISPLEEALIAAGREINASRGVRDLLNKQL